MNLIIPGSSTTPRPCDQRFLDFLVRDLQDLKQTLILLDPIMEGLDDTMDPTRSMLSQNIVRIMEECRRLRAAPELFPTASSRKVFFKMISIIADQLAGFAQLKACAADFEQRARNSIKHQPAAPVLAKRVGKIWFKTYQNGSSEQRQKLPDLHPHSFSTKKPWNKWLDNFEEPAYPGIYTSIITQRIPLVALKLIQRHRFMYGVVKRSYEAVSTFTYYFLQRFVANKWQANRVIRKQKVLAFIAVGLLICR